MEIIQNNGSENQTQFPEATVSGVFGHSWEILKKNIPELLLVMFVQILLSVPVGFSGRFFNIYAGMFTTGLRLAFPALALLALVDLSLALLGRLTAQLQLLTLSFPLKMLAAVGVLALIAPLFPRLLGAYGHEISAALKAVVEHP